MRYIHFSIAGLIVSVSMARSLAWAATADGPNADAGSKNRWTADAICAALAWREGQLRNCSFAFSEDCTIFHPHTSKEALDRKSELTVRRKDGATLVDVTDHYTESTSLDRDHVLLLWDGSTSRSLVRKKPHAGTAELFGRIDHEEPTDFRLYKAFNVLGLREFNKDRPWSTWIRSMLATKGTESTVTEGIDQGGDRFVRLMVNPGDFPPDRFTFTFLPGKDFVIEDLDGEPKYKNGTHFGWHVARLKQFDGLWVPMDTNHTVADKELGNRIHIVIKSFSLKPPSEADMRIDFPVGTHVMDVPGLAYYTILPDGKRKYERFYDANTGKIIEPSSPAQPAATRP